MVNNMHDVFYWLTGHELEAHRILSLADRNESDVMRTCGDYYQTHYTLIMKHQSMDT
jgi:hypothetical protein